MSSSTRNRVPSSPGGYGDYGDFSAVPPPPPPDDYYPDVPSSSPPQKAGMQVTEKVKFAFNNLNWQMWVLIVLFAGGLLITFIIAAVGLGVSISSKAESAKLSEASTSSPDVSICDGQDELLGDSVMYLTEEGCAGAFSSIYNNVILQQANFGPVTMASESASSIFAATCLDDTQVIGGTCSYTENTIFGFPPALSYTDINLNTNQFFCRWVNHAGSAAKQVTFNVEAICRVIV